MHYSGAMHSRGICDPASAYSAAPRELPLFSLQRSPSERFFTAPRFQRSAVVNPVVLPRDGSPVSKDSALAPARLSFFYLWGQLHSLPNLLQSY